MSSGNCPWRRESFELSVTLGYSETGYAHASSLCRIDRGNEVPSKGSADSTNGNKDVNCEDDTRVAMTKAERRIPPGLDS
ncbi:hypothetical protein RJZ57_005867 [Blastomyces gilchristii]